IRLGAAGPWIPAGEIADFFPSGALRSSPLTQQLRDGIIPRETLIRLGTAGPWIPAGEIADFIGLRERGPGGGLSLPPPKQAAGTTSQAPPSSSRQPNRRARLDWVLGICTFLCGMAGATYWLSTGKNTAPDRTLERGDAQPRDQGDQRATAGRKAPS